MQVATGPVKKIIWINIIFFAVTTFLGVIGCPLYAYYHGVSAIEVALFLFYAGATGMGITVGYHRLFAHSTYKANALIRFLLLFFGGAAFEQTALDWASQHRDHHRYVDTDLDPYSIKKGFFYAHMGWLMFWKHEIHYGNSIDLQKDSMVMHQHKNYMLWAVGAGIVTPVLVGALFGHALGAFLFAVCLRITFVYHSTFCINSVCHIFGKATYDTQATAKDHWLVALVTFGEGYHNFHHKFPVDYRNGIRWFDWDPSKWLIRVMAGLGMVWDLKRTSQFRILEARLAGEKTSVTASLKQFVMPPVLAKPVEQLSLHYAVLRQKLESWEDAVRNYRELLKQQMAAQSEELKTVAAQKMQDARDCFQQAHEEWHELVNTPPRQLLPLLLSAVPA